VTVAGTTLTCEGIACNYDANVNRSFRIGGAAGSGVANLRMASTADAASVANNGQIGFNKDTNGGSFYFNAGTTLANRADLILGDLVLGGTGFTSGRRWKLQAGGTQGDTYTLLGPTSPADADPAVSSMTVTTAAGGTLAIGGSLSVGSTLVTTADATVVANAIAVTASIDAVAITTDATLTTITGGTQGQLLLIATKEDGKTVTITDTSTRTANTIHTAGAVTLDKVSDKLLLRFNGSWWDQVAACDNE
jgi:hypothetical protein